MMGQIRPTVLLHSPELLYHSAKENFVNLNCKVALSPARISTFWLPWNLQCFIWSLMVVSDRKVDRHMGQWWPVPRNLCWDNNFLIAVTEKKMKNLCLHVWGVHRLSKPSFLRYLPAVPRLNIKPLFIWFLSPIHKFCVMLKNHHPNSRYFFFSKMIISFKDTGQWKFTLENLFPSLRANLPQFVHCGFPCKRLISAFQKCVFETLQTRVKS